MKIKKRVYLRIIPKYSEKNTRQVNRQKLNEIKKAAKKLFKAEKIKTQIKQKKSQLENQIAYASKLSKHFITTLSRQLREGY